jgi:hypothetical protein
MSSTSRQRCVGGWRTADSSFANSLLSDIDIAGASMGKLLYRFRGIASLTGSRAELRDQYIYFPDPSTLNDPMEGFRDVYWLGDGIVWRGLFKHYLGCLIRACELEALGSGSRPIDWSQIPVIDTRHADEIPVGERAMEAEIQSAFFTPAADALIEALAARTVAMRREELSLLIRAIHYGSIALVRQGIGPGLSGASHGSESSARDQLQRGMENAMASVRAAEALAIANPGREKSSAEFFATGRQTFLQMELIQRYGGGLPADRLGTEFVVYTFPDEYASQLERLLFPEWFAACFMEDCRDAALWAYYGENHTGACLVFDVGDQPQPTLGLTRQIGIGAGGPIMGSVAHPFEPVTYEDAHPAIDFFRSIASLPTPVIAQRWYLDSQGGRSASSDELFDDPDAWRERHWRSFRSGTTTKLRDWSRERESRLILQGGHDYSRPESRSLRYDFGRLHGVIFGVKTSWKDKLGIARVIEAKCRESGRADFKFYQAYFSPASDLMEHCELRHFKFA